VKRLILVPIIGVVLILCSMALGAEQMALFNRAILVVSLAVTGISGLVTAFKFDTSDRLFKCWLLIGVGYAFSIVRHGLRLLATVIPGLTLSPQMGNVFLMVQNICIAVALILFVLAWRATGLTAPVSRAAQTTSIIIGIAVAVVVGGYPLFTALTSAQLNFGLLVSTAGDIIGFCVIVPLALSALAMRGGLLMHTWIYLALSEVSWLLYDLWWAARPSLAPNASGAILEALRVMAVLFAFIATVAQRRAMR
jgi:hypothetical protein